MTKSKRILELAKDIARKSCYLYDRCPKQPKHNCVSLDPEIQLESTKNYITIATWLVEEGYQKVSKDEVVISKSDYRFLEEYKQSEKSLLETLKQRREM